MIQHTYIELFGLQLMDPLTFVTDVMMSVVAFYCGHKLFYDHKLKYAKYAGMFFLFLGISSFIGGSSHLLEHYFGKVPHLVAWTVQGISILFVELASIRVIKQAKLKNLLRMFVYAFFGVFISQLLNIQHFNVVKINTTVGLIGFTTVIHIVSYFLNKERVFLKVPMAICLFLLPAIIHGLGIAFNAWFNQNVLSHLVLLPCYFFLYKGFDAVAKYLATSKTLQAQQL